MTSGFNYLVIKNLSKKFDDFYLKDISFSIGKGEMLILFGQSGSGKSTILRLISGIINPDKGEIFLDGENIINLKTYKRNFGIVFQDFALFPHLSVKENIAFGLKIQKKSKKEIQKKISYLLELVGLSGYEKRKIEMLSGGEKQRVALARTLAPEPNLILFDEPLSALDENMRINLRKEIRAIQKELNFTGIFVTHDRKEAFELGDKIALISKGKMLQFGEPKTLYLHPDSSEVAEFIGINNKFIGKIIDKKTRLYTAKMGDIQIDFSSQKNYRINEEVDIFIKSELCFFSNEKKAQNTFEIKIEDIVDYGQNLEITLNCGWNIIKMLVSRPNMPISELSQVKLLTIPVESINTFRRKK